MFRGSLARSQPTNIAAPASATARPAASPALNLSLKRSHPPKATKAGARLTSSVELATEVRPTAQCHRAMSPVKNSPARTRARRSPYAKGRRAVRSRPSAIRVHRKRIGTARATRQNAVALGPNSLRRTQTGEGPKARAPATRKPGPQKEGGARGGGAPECRGAGPQLAQAHEDG